MSFRGRMCNPTIFSLLVAAYGAGAWALPQSTVVVGTNIACFTEPGDAGCTSDTAWLVPLPIPHDYTWENTATSFIPEGTTSAATESSQNHPDSTSTTTTTLAFHHQQQQEQQLALDPSPAPGPNRHPNLARRDLPPRPTPTPIAITLSGGAAPLTLNPAGSVYVVNGNPSATLAPGPDGSATTLTLPGGTVLAMMKSDELADDDAGPYLVVAQAPGGAQAVATVPPPPAPIPSNGGDDRGGPGGRGGGGGGGRGDGPSPAEQSAAAAAASAAVVTVGALELSPAGGSGAYNVLKSVSGGGVGVAATLAPGGSVTVDGVVVALRTDGPSGQTVVVTGKAGDGGGATAPAATVTATERAPAGSGGAGDNPPVAVGNLTFLPAGSAYWIAEGTRTWTVVTGASVTVGGTVVGLTTDAGGRTVVVENAGNQTATATASTVATLGPGGSGGTPVGQGSGGQGGGGGGGGGPLMTSDRMGAPVATNGVPTSAGVSHRIKNLWSNEALWIGWIVGLLLFINI